MLWWRTGAMNEHHSVIKAWACPQHPAGQEFHGMKGRPDN